MRLVPTGERAGLRPTVQSALDRGDVAAALASVAPVALTEEVRAAAAELLREAREGTWVITVDVTPAGEELAAVDVYKRQLPGSGGTGGGGAVRRRADPAVAVHARSRQTSADAPRVGTGGSRLADGPDGAAAAPHAGRRPVRLPGLLAPVGDGTPHRRPGHGRGPAPDDRRARRGDPARRGRPADHRRVGVGDQAGHAGADRSPARPGADLRRHGVRAGRHDAGAGGDHRVLAPRLPGQRRAVRRPLRRDRAVGLAQRDGHDRGPFHRSPPGPGHRRPARRRGARPAPGHAPLGAAGGGRGPAQHLRLLAGAAAAAHRHPGAGEPSGARPVAVPLGVRGRGARTGAHAAADRRLAAGEPHGGRHADPPGRGRRRGHPGRLRAGRAGRPAVRAGPGPGPSVAGAGRDDRRRPASGGLRGEGRRTRAVVPELLPVRHGDALRLPQPGRDVLPAEPGRHRQAPVPAQPLRHRGRWPAAGRRDRQRARAGAGAGAHLRAAARQTGELHRGGLRDDR